jgi:hypothetical protein
MALSYEEFVLKYPCPDRRGMGYSGCTCTNNYKQDPRYVDCAAYASHTTIKENCIICPFRLQHESRLKQLNG